MTRRSGPGAFAGAHGADGGIAGRRSLSHNTAAARAAIAVGFGDRPRLRLVSWKPLRKGALGGFANFELPIGLKISDVPVLISNGKAWAALPAKPVLDAEGRLVQPDGKPQYAAILQWRNHALADRFSIRVVQLVRQAHPGALEEGGQ